MEGTDEAERRDWLKFCYFYLWLCIEAEDELASPDTTTPQAPSVQQSE